MNFEEVKLAYPCVAEAATTALKGRAENLTFILKKHGCASFLESNGWFMWYWFDFTNKQWQETHMLKDDNWILH